MDAPQYMLVKIITVNMISIRPMRVAAALVLSPMIRNSPLTNSIQGNMRVPTLRNQYGMI
jgi:hypothetical protein